MQATARMRALRERRVRATAFRRAGSARGFEGTARAMFVGVGDVSRRVDFTRERGVTVAYLVPPGFKQRLVDQHGATSRVVASHLDAVATFGGLEIIESKMLAPDAEPFPLTREEREGLRGQHVSLKFPFE